MKQGLVELVIIIDKSGSMGGLEQDVIGGYNTLIKEQCKHDGEVVVSTILFNDKAVYLNERVNVKEVKDMVDKDYFPSGCTALLDAVGNAITKTKSAQMLLNEDERPEKIIFSIMTDGYENSSHEYRYCQIKNMIENQKKDGWEFMFQAANIDSFAEGNRLGISNEDIACFESTSNSVQSCFMTMGCAIDKKISKKRK